MKTKICGNCNKIKVVTGFYKQKGGKFGVRSICKICCIEQSKNYKTFNYQSAKSRAIKLGAIAIWADVKKIKEFYERAKLYTEKCSMNYSVDHIDPLQHWLVCGLHVETNLQILTELENSSKRNDFIPYRIDQDGKIHRLKIDPLWNKNCASSLKSLYPTTKENSPIFRPGNQVHTLGEDEFNAFPGRSLYLTVSFKLASSCFRFAARL